MKILRKIEEYEKSAKPVVLTIGNFDGLHLGHQQLINRVASIAKERNGVSVVLTFHKHPFEILRPDVSIDMLYTLKQKIALIENLHIDVLMVLEFTKEFAEQTAEQFLKRIFKSMPLSYLVLGYDSKIGKGREGDRDKLFELARKLSFDLEYIDRYEVAGKTVSSSKVREAIGRGDLTAAKNLLGRDYSIMGIVERSDTSVIVGVKGLCIPPDGEYPILVKFEEQSIKGTVTIHNGIVEVRVSYPIKAGSELEIVFLKVIRPSRPDSKAT